MITAKQNAVNPPQLTAFFIISLQNGLEITRFECLTSPRQTDWVISK